MKRPDRLASSQGLLLVEAVLSAVVIAVGLVFISRGLGGQLRSLEVVEAYDRLLPLAQSKLSELEGWGLKQQTIPQAEWEGEFEEPDAGCLWQLKASARAVVADSPELSNATLTVYFKSSPARKVTLEAVWPSSWLTGGA